jgi:hypothetical protein
MASYANTSVYGNIPLNPLVSNMSSIEDVEMLEVRCYRNLADYECTQRINAKVREDLINAEILYNKLNADAPVFKLNLFKLNVDALEFQPSVKFSRKSRYRKIK